MDAATAAEPSKAVSEGKIALFFLFVTLGFVVLYLNLKAPRRADLLKADAQAELTSVTQNLSAQSLCVKTKARYFIKASGYPITPPILDEFVLECAEHTVTDETARAQLNILDSTN